jgi:uncharacterized protein YjdB
MSKKRKTGVIAALLVVFFAAVFTGVSGCANLVIQPKEITGVSLNKTTLALPQGGSEQLVASVTPSTASVKSLVWSSDDPSVTVSATGQITAVGMGTATVTAMTLDGSYSAECVVTVLSAAVTGLSLNKNAATIGLGMTEQLTAQLTPEYALNKSVTWTSDSANATVSASGLVTAVALGSATITATSVDGGYTDTCVVTVIPVPASGVSLNATSLSMSAGESETLIATVHPTNAANKNVSWSSSDTSVAVVIDGIVGAFKAGTAVITVTTEDGGFKATCTVTVTGSLSHSYLEILPAATALQNGIYAAAASIDPASTAYNTVTLNPIVMICHLNGYVDSGYTLTGQVAISYYADYSQGPANGTVSMTGGTVTEISYNDAVLTTPKSGSIGIRFTDGSSWTLDLATGNFHQN